MELFFATFAPMKDVVIDKTQNIHTLIIIHYVPFYYVWNYCEIYVD